MSEQLQQRIRNLKAQLSRTPQQEVERLNYPTAWESGITHPFLPIHMLCRDDGVVDISAGPGASVTVDQGQAQITLDATKVAIKGEDVHLHAPALGLWFGYQRFDPGNWWTEGPSNPMGLNFFWNGPLVANNAGAYAALLSTPLVAGPPDVEIGQFNVTLGQWLHAQSLLGPSESLRILAEKMGQLAKELVPH